MCRGHWCCSAIPQHHCGHGPNDHGVARCWETSPGLHSAETLNVRELARLQGLVLPRTGRLATPETYVSKCIGNAMSQNVLQCVIPHLCYAAGLTAELKKSKWRLAATVSGLTRLPEQVYNLID